MVGVLNNDNLDLTEGTWFVLQLSPVLVSTTGKYLALRFFRTKIEEGYVNIFVIWEFGCYERRLVETVDPEFK